MVNEVINPPATITDQNGMQLTDASSIIKLIDESEEYSAEFVFSMFVAVGRAIRFKNQTN